MITTEASSTQTRQRADTATLPWGPKRTCSALAVGFAFQRIDIVLNGDTIFYLPGFFQLIHCVSTSYRQQQNKNPDLFPCTVIPMHL